MKNFTKLTIGAMMIAGAMSVNAQNRQDLMFLVGDALSYGWSLDDATALVATAENDKVYTGTVYLEQGKDFKFLTTYDWGNDEYHPIVNGANPDAEGKVAMQLNGDDNKIKVTESGNYLITLDTEALTATIVKSAYQDSPINIGVLYMIGSATTGGWSCDAGTAMVQDPSTPYVYTAKTTLKADGSFKINWAIKGAGRTFDSKYYYFRDSADDSKMVLASSEDNQWTVPSDGVYTVTADIINNTIQIKSGSDGIVAVEAEEESEAVYYNMQGVRVANPAKGNLVIKVAGGKAQKMVF